MIYPEIETDIRESPEGKNMIFRTTLRKKHKGKWYLWEFFREIHLGKDEMNGIISAIKSFTMDIYFADKIGKINPKMTAPNRREVFRLDPDQTNEVDRISKILKLN